MYTLTLSHTERMVTQVFLWNTFLTGGSFIGEGRGKKAQLLVLIWSNRTGKGRKLLLISTELLRFSCFPVNLRSSEKNKITHLNTPILILHKPKPFGWPWSRSSFFAITRWRRSRTTSLLASLGGWWRTRAWVRSFSWGWRPPVGPGAGSLLIKK